MSDDQLRDPAKRLRQKRLEDQLRENLKRRRQQSKARRQEGEQDQIAEPSGACGEGPGEGLDGMS